MSPFPLPKPLPETISKLREEEDLNQDVWVAPGDQHDAPPWVRDSAIREGIRSLHKLDRCKEEMIRLQHEANNMILWFSNRRMLLEICLRLPKSRGDVTFSTPSPLNINSTIYSSWVERTAIQTFNRVGISSTSMDESFDGQHCLGLC